MEAQHGLIADDPHLVLGQQLPTAGLAPAPVLEGVVQQDGNRLGQRVDQPAADCGSEWNAGRFVVLAPHQDHWMPPALAALAAARTRAL